MTYFNFSNIFGKCINAMQNLNVTSVRYGRPKRSYGNRKVRNARKYRRPEDLEDPNYHDIGPKKQIVSLSQSISAKGFAREQQSYQPPKNVDEQLYNICKKLYGQELTSDWKSQTFSDLLMKYKVLTKSIQIFKKNVPSSLLHKMNNIEDLVTYFSTPVDGCLHYDALVRDNDKLPPNLHVMSDSVTFNPDTDTYFDGVTAFPGRKRIIHTKTGEKFEKVIEWPNI